MGKDTESQIREIADHYSKYDPEWKMKPGERRKVLEYLMLGYSVDSICDAITGMHLSDFHRGKNPDKAVHLSIQYVFREHNFDKFRKLARESADKLRAELRRRRELDDIGERNRESEKESSELYMTGFRHAKRGGDTGGRDVVE